MTDDARAAAEAVERLRNLGEYRPEPGEHVERAAKRLLADGGTFMVFNDIRVEVEPGDTCGKLVARWQAVWVARREEQRRLEREQWPEHVAYLP